MPSTAASTAATRFPGVTTRSRRRSSKSAAPTSAEQSETRSPQQRPEGQQAGEDRPQAAEAGETICEYEDWEEEEDDGGLEWEDLLPDSPRLDFFFSSAATTAEQRSLVYRCALLFATALPSASLLDVDEVEDWMDACQVSVDGCGGSGELEIAEADEEQEEEEAAEGGCHPPFQLVFPSPKRVSDFLAYLTHVAPHSIWSRQQQQDGAEDEQAEQQPDSGSGGYQPAVRLHWRMNLSGWIPAYC